MTTSYLVLFDADRIKDYVFATGRLKEIRGASEQVRRLTDYGPAGYQAPTFKAFALQRWEPGASEGVIYASGGAGAVLFAGQERAAQFCEQLEREVRRQTASATLSAIWEPVRYGDFVGRKEAEAAAQQRAAQKLACRKASRPQAELIPGGGVIRFCASDRLRPANSHIRDVEGDSLFAGESTVNKRLNNQRYRNGEAVVAGPVWQAFERHLVQESKESTLDAWRSAIDPSQDLGGIAAVARPEGYVALVYGDGDRVGATIRTVVQKYGFAGYQKLSEALSYGATQATARALATAYGTHAPSGNSPALPFEVITVGGDDVILICTAEHGVALACTLAGHFHIYVTEYLSREPDPIQLEQPITMSVGVVIAHDSLPIVQLERRGRELLKSAKKIEGGGVDFHIVSTPAIAEIKTIRARGYRFGDTDLTSRPYARATLEDLLFHARRLRGLCDEQGRPVLPLGSQEPQRLPDIPGSKRADLYRACYAERIQATLDVLAVQMRMKSYEREMLMRTLLALGYGIPYPFRHEQERNPPYHTALIDLLELMEFVAEEGQWGPSSVQR